MQEKSIFVIQKQQFTAIWHSYCNILIRKATSNRKIEINFTKLNSMKKYVCDVCGWEYDPAVGIEEAGIAPGTAWEDLPSDFACPLCGVG